MSEQINAGGNNATVGEFIFDANGIKVDDTWIYVGVLLGVFVAFRIVALLALVRKASSF